MKTNALQQAATRNRVLVLSSFVFAGTLLAAILTYTATPEYESSVTFKVKPANDGQASLSLFPVKQTAVTEEITSEPFLKKTLEQKNGFIETYVSYDFRTQYSYYSFPYQVTFRTINNADYDQQSYKITSDDNKTFTVESTSSGVTRTKKGTFGEEFIDNNLALTITKKENKPVSPDYLIAAPGYSFTINSPYSLTKDLASGSGKITATDHDGLVTLKVKSASPVMANQIANTVAQSYVKKQNPDIPQSGVFPGDAQIAQMEKQIAETEKEISKYKKANLLTEMDADADAAQSMYKDLQLKQTSLELQMAALDNLTNYIRKNRSVNNSQVEYGVIQDPSFSEQLSKLNTKYEQKANGSTSPTLDTEIENLKTLIAERILNTRKKTAVQIDKINEAIALAEKKVSRLPEQASMIASLERKMQLDKLVYNKLIERKANYIIDHSTGIVSDRIIKPATTPLSPVYPVSWLFLAVGAVSGLLLGSLVNLLVQMFKTNTIKSTEDLQIESAVPYIATIPSVFHHTRDKVAAVGNLCTSVLMKKGIKFITIASSNTGDGKTFIATKLGQSLAALDKKVLLLDMNFDTPEVAAIFGITPEYSLSDVITGKCDVHDAISLTSFPNLEVLTPGTHTSGLNLFLSSEKRAQLIETMRKTYDYIIIDTPVTNDHSEEIAMMTMSDLNLYLVKANSTRKSSLISVDKLRNDFNINNLYLILNAGSLSKNSNTGNKNNRTRSRSIDIKRNERNQKDQQPTFLKRIALWFY